MQKNPDRNGILDKKIIKKKDQTGTRYSFSRVPGCPRPQSSFYSQTRGKHQPGGPSADSTQCHAKEQLLLKVQVGWRGGEARAPARGSGSGSGFHEHRRSRRRRGEGRARSCASPPGGLWPGLGGRRGPHTHPSAPSPAAAPRPRPLAAPGDPARSGAAAPKTSPARPGRRRRLPPSFTGSPAPAPTRRRAFRARLPGNRGRGGAQTPRFPPPPARRSAPRSFLKETGSETFPAGTRPRKPCVLSAARLKMLRPPWRAAYTCGFFQLHNENILWMLCLVKIAAHFLVFFFFFHFLVLIKLSHLPYQRPGGTSSPMRELVLRTKNTVKALCTRSWRRLNPLHSSEICLSSCLIPCTFMSLGCKGRSSSSPGHHRIQNLVEGKER